MRLKSFHASSMSEAMQQVKDTLGEDAIIISTREGPGGRIRITAAVEQEDDHGWDEGEARNGVPADMFTDDDDSIEILTDMLLKHRVSSEASDRIISAALNLPAEYTPDELLAAALDECYGFDPLPMGRHINPLVLVGPPGAGKTLTAAKLAARARLEGLNPAVITTDTVRAGGIEQLSAFLDVLSMELLEAPDPAALKKALKASIDADQIIIDTGGLNPFDPQEMKDLAKLLSVEDMDAVLVLPAGGDAEESSEIAQTFSVLGVKRLLPTRLDFARRLGGIVCAADKAGLSFTDASHTPQVADGLVHMTPETLAAFLLPHS